MEAHKVILAASSPFFQNILRRNQHPHPLIFMRGLKSEDLVAIVDFLYCGEANVLQKNLDSFLAIAEELQLKGLMGQNDEESEMTENKIIAPRETKSPFRIDGNPVAPTNKVEKIDGAVALTLSSLSGVGLEELAERVKSFMEKTHQRTQNGRGYLYTCKVCGKKGQSIHIQNHIEANHLEGVSLPCNMCDMTARSRRELTEHKHTYHTVKL